MPQLDIAFFIPQLFWLFVTFGLFLVVVKFLILPKLSFLVERRAGKISGDLTEAENLQKQAEILKANYQKSIITAREKAREAVSLAALKAKIEKDKKLAEKNLLLELELGKASASIAEMKQSSVNIISQVASEAAPLLTRKIIG